MRAEGSGLMGQQRFGLRLRVSGVSFRKGAKLQWFGLRCTVFWFRVDARLSAGVRGLGSGCGIYERAIRC